MTVYKIAIIGAGAVGTRMGLALSALGHEVVQVISQKIESAVSLADKLGATASTDIANLVVDVELILLTVPDDIINQVINSIPYTGQILVHTSGTFPLEGFGKKIKKCGVIYPLQTFSRDRYIEFKSVPLFIEACNEYVSTVLMTIGHQLSNTVHLLSSSDRQRLHLSAVFASNFITYLIGNARSILSELKLEADVLIPLVNETVDKALKMDVRDAQTGPARRGDIVTIKKHLDLLSCCQNEKDIYLLLTRAILEQYGFEYY